MSFNKQISRPQSAAVLAAFVLILGLLIWLSVQFRSQSAIATRPVEMAPVVEEVVAPPGEGVAASRAGETSDDAARRREVLESIKWSRQHGQ